MHFAFTEDQEMLRDAVKDVLTRECAPAVVRDVWEKNATHAETSVWTTLADTGVVGMAASEEAGGMGMNMLDAVLPLDEAGYAALPEPLVETAVVGVPLFEALASDAQKETWLKKLLTGQARVAVAFEGQTLVPHACAADLFLCVRKEAVYAVPSNRVSWIAEVSVDRTRHSATLPKDMVFEDGDVMVRRDGNGDTHIERTLQVAYERAVVGTSALLIGLARRMLDMTVAYAKQREQFGKPIGAQQAVQHRLANALIQLSFARPVVFRAAWCLDKYSLSESSLSDDTKVAVSMAKYYATEAAHFVAKQALQVHGAIGYTIECDLHMWMKRVWSLAALYGDVALHRERVGSVVLPSYLN